MGLLKPFLEETCNSHPFKLCDYKECLPNDILWGADSPLNKDGGWVVNNERYKSLVFCFFTKPKFVKKFIIKCVESTAIQFFTFDAVIVIPERENGFPFPIFQRVLPEQINAIRFSKQYQGKWNNDLYNALQKFLIYISFLWIVYVLFFSRFAFGRIIKQAGALILISLIANALFCSCVSMIDERFQARVIWIVPLYAIWLLFDAVSQTKFASYLD